MEIWNMAPNVEYLMNWSGSFQSLDSPYMYSCAHSRRISIKMHLKRLCIVQGETVQTNYFNTIKTAFWAEIWAIPSFNGGSWLTDRYNAAIDHDTMIINEYVELLWRSATITKNQFPFYRTKCIREEPISLPWNIVITYYYYYWVHINTWRKPNQLPQCDVSREIKMSSVLSIDE